MIFYPTQAFAENEFSTSYDVTYDIGKDGIAQVVQKIGLKNLTDRYYASNFTLTIGSTTVQEVTAFNESGAMETSVENKGNKTVITVKFNQQIAGLDKVQAFTLKFKSKDFAQAIGKTWEVNLPKIPEATNIDKYNLSLLVPVSFGDPTSISPLPKSQSTSLDRLNFNFSKNQLEQSGVSVNFGTSQVFDFNIKYDLENTSVFPVTTSITLPPDTEYQDVAINQVEPLPSNVTIDEDGNYLAWYRLSGNSKETIIATGSAYLRTNSKFKKPETVTSSLLSQYTKSDQYWEKDNPAITATLAEVFKNGKPKDNKGKAHLIYRYVVDTLKYDTKRIENDNFERLGAVTALNNPGSSVCMEFTDLFIALSRAAGVPARELDGYAYTQNTNLRPLSFSRDLLHAWPEYYDDDKGWVMVDPTWENTSGGVDYFNKFDLSHFVLARRGITSNSPYISDKVKVVISESEFKAIPSTRVEVDVPQSLWAGFPGAATVKVTNTGNVLKGPDSIEFKSGKIENQNPSTVNLGPIPPYGSTTYKFNLKTPFVWQSFEDTVEINVTGQEIVKKVLVKPFFLFYPVPYLFGGLLALVVGTYASILFVHIHRKKSSTAPAE